MRQLGQVVKHLLNDQANTNLCNDRNMFHQYSCMFNLIPPKNAVETLLKYQNILLLREPGGLVVESAAQIRVCN